MTKILETTKLTKNTLKPRQWLKYHQKPHNWPIYPQNLNYDKYTPKAFKMTKIPLNWQKKEKNLRALKWPK